MKNKIEKLVEEVKTLTTEAKELKAKLSYQYSHQVMSVDNRLLLPVKEEVVKHFEDHYKEEENIKLTKAEEKIKQLKEQLEKSEIMNFLMDE